MRLWRLLKSGGLGWFSLLQALEFGIFNQIEFEV